MDKKSKHTPGPWKIGPEATDLMNPDCANGRFHSIDAKDHGALAVVVTQMGDDFGADTSERLIANAQLIAAAPDLLAALIEMTAEAEAWLDDARGCKPADLMDDGAFVRAHAAILKATGGAS